MKGPVIQRDIASDNSDTTIFIHDIALTVKLEQSSLQLYYHFGIIHAIISLLKQLYTI